MDKAREAAMNVLHDVFFGGAYANMALKESFQKNRNLQNIDKAFITNIVYGTIKFYITIDYIIKSYSKVKLKKISPYILTILRMGIYQIKFMDKVPDSAAVNESINLSKRYGHKASAGFVNGILRNVLRNEINLPEDIGIRYSFPDWLAKQWVSDYGEEFACDLMNAMNSEPKVTVRVNGLKANPEEIAKKLPNAEISEIYEKSILCDGLDIANSELYKKGCFTPQDISASLAAVVLNPKEGEDVLDICAAPGGKSTHMAELMNNKGSITACDIHEHKIKIIKDNAERLGINIINAIKNDALAENENFKGKFDKVLADVPCSGLGIIRRKPDIKLNENIKEITELQYRILENAGKYLKAGGEMVYSTCTLNKRENEDTIKKFLKNNKGYKAVDISGFLPDKLKKEEAKNGYITFYPNKDAIDGFFIAKIKRCADD